MAGPFALESRRLIAGEKLGDQSPAQTGYFPGAELSWSGIHLGFFGLTPNPDSPLPISGIAAILLDCDCLDSVKART